MRAYRVVWTLLCAALALAGTTAAFVLSPAVLLFLFLAFAAVGPILTPALVRDFWDRPPRERAGLLLTGAVLSGTGAGAAAGLGAILGSGAVPLVLVVTSSSPPAVNLYRRWVCPTPPRPPERLDTPVTTGPRTPPAQPPVPPLSELRRLTDEQLCQGWRASFLALQLRPSAASTLETVRARQRFLDEFERRHPSGLTAWLASGARAAGNPLPYLVDGRADRHAIDWDELTRGQDR